MAIKEESGLTILRRKQVEARTGLSRSSIYQLMADGAFPKSVRLGGPRAVGWLEHEIEDFLAQLVKQSRKAA